MKRKRPSISELFSTPAIGKGGIRVAFPTLIEKKSYLNYPDLGNHTVESKVCLLCIYFGLSQRWPVFVGKGS